MNLALLFQSLSGVHVVSPNFARAGLREGEVSKGSDAVGGLKFDYMHTRAIAVKSSCTGRDSVAWLAAWAPLLAPFSSKCITNLKPKQKNLLHPVLHTSELKFLVRNSWI